MTVKFLPITLAQIKQLKVQGARFSVRYERCGKKGSKPAYHCYYQLGETLLLLHARSLQAGGQQPKRISLWPGLVSHHQRYGDGALLTIDVSQGDV